MIHKRLFPVLLLGILCLPSCTHHSAHYREQKELLGELLFHDTSLSEPAGQSCATCHTLAKGFADVESRPVSEGAVKGLYSQRNAMTVSYSMFVPDLYYDEEEETYVGGLFWDGRASTLQAQAGEPFLNPVEMGNSDRRMVVDKVKRTPYYSQLLHIYGETEDVDSIYAHITDALAMYQSSKKVCPFSSKYDAYKKGSYTLTAQEKLGLELFKHKGLCAECHILDRDVRARRTLFTDHTYDNLGIPKNPENPHYRVPSEYFLLTSDSLDLGLGAIVRKPEENGKFRVPTLRNVELTAPYGHNGYFKTLGEIVHFYNVRDVSNEFPPAEYPATVNKDELGDLKLTAEEEAALVAFMKTLTDGYMKKGHHKDK
ncbi:cytochrome-c peroxidase [Bacteroides sp.]